MGFEPLNLELRECSVPPITIWASTFQNTIPMYKIIPVRYRLVSSIFLIAHFLVHSNVDLVSSLIALFAARKVAQMTTEMIECYHLR